MKTKNLYLKTLLLMGAAAMLFSCAKDELDTSNATIEYGPARHLTFSTQLAAPFADKAALDIASNKVKWEAGDVITVNNGTSDPLAAAGLDVADPTHATFEGNFSPNTTLENGKDVYRSVYPASIIKGTIPADANPMAVTLPATAFGSGDPTAAQIANNPMAAYEAVNSGATGIFLHYKNLCTVLKVEISAASGATGVDAQVSRLRFASASGLSGDYNVTFNSNGEPVLTAQNPSAGNIVEMVFSTPVDITSEKTFYIMMPPVASEGFVMQIWNGDGSKRIQKEKASATLARNYVNTATINEAFEDWGGAYSMADNQRVYFAHGNLKYHFTQDQWRFFDEQYGMCTRAEVENTLSQNNDRDRSSDPGYIAVPQNGNASYIPAIEAKANAIHDLDQWTDHFNFGNTGHYAGSIFYQPWHTFYGLLHNGGITVHTGYGYGPVNAYSVAQHLAGTNSDWGVYHRTELNNSLTPVAGDWRTQRGDWRTPTQAEWLYVIQGAKRIDNIAIAFKYGLARIEVAPGTFVNGLMMIPDHWHWFLMPGGHTFKPFEAGITAVNDYADNTYTLAEWQSLDELGACFLPAGGTRLDWLMDYGKGGFYQSASAALNVAANQPNGWQSPNQRGFSMHFYSADANSATAPGYPLGKAGVWGPQEGTYIGAFNKIDGHCVRLVRNTTDD